MKRTYNQSGQWALVVGMLMLALLLGVAVPLVVSSAGDHYSRLLALPALLILGGLFVFKRNFLFLLIVLLRSAGDNVFEAMRAGGGGNGFNPGMGGAINALVILIAFLYVVSEPKRVPRVVVIPWVILLLVAMAGLVVSPEKGAALKIVLSQMSYFAMFISAFYVVRSPEDFRSLIKLVIWSSVIPALYGVFTVATNLGGLGGFRLQSTFTHPNIMAFYLTLVLSMGLYALKSPNFKWNQIQRIGLTGYMLFLLLLLLLTQTRSAWIAAFVMFVLYGTLFERRYLFYLMLLPVVALMIPSVYDRVAQLDTGNSGAAYARLNSFAWRMVLWKSGLNFMDASHYLQGYGVEAFLHYSRTFFPLAGNIQWAAHNVFVQWFFDTGVIGIVAYLSVFWFVIRTLAKLYPIDRLGACMLVFIALEHLIVSASDNVLAYLAFNWYFWLLCGAGCALYFNSDLYRERQEAARQKKLTGRRFLSVTASRPG